MKRININEYKKEMGELIDVEDQYTYSLKHYPGSINIPYQKLNMNYKTLLDKNKKYYIMCQGGYKSKKIVSILEFYGYDVTQVYI